MSARGASVYAVVLVLVAILSATMAAGLTAVEASIDEYPNRSETLERVDPDTLADQDGAVREQEHDGDVRSAHTQGTGRRRAEESPTTASPSSPTKSPTQKRPNVVLIIADDVGYLDISANGNNVVKTPFLDKFRSQSVRLEDYHTYPTCAPSRASIMTGRYAARVGVWHTIMFLNVVRPGEKMMPEIFLENGYSTALIGKWHLGDNYPSRARDRGFQFVFGYPGGGLGQAPDVWGNSNFDPTFFRDGVPEKRAGFCTDILFDEAISYARTAPEPFFLVVSPNAAHAPQSAPQDYLAQYASFPKAAPFYGMVTNLDSNIERLDVALADAGRKDNTIFIFTSDNGSACGPARCPWSSKGVSGFKSSVFEGGHRVAFFLRWPRGGFVSKVVDNLLMSIDIMPTLLDMCGIQYNPMDASHKLDGRSFKLLMVPGTTNLAEQISTIQEAIDERILVIEDPRVAVPEKWANAVVLHKKWRLITTQKLYNVGADPLQQSNVAGKNPDFVKMMNQYYNAYWNEMQPSFHELDTYIGIGSPFENPVEMNPMDWTSSGTIPPWEQKMILEGRGAKFGAWRVNVLKEGEYQIIARKYPASSNLGFNYGKVKVDLAVFKHDGVTYQKSIGKGAQAAVLSVRLVTGVTSFSVLFKNKGKSVGTALFVSVELATPSPTTKSPTTGLPSRSPTTRSPTRRPTASPSTPKPTKTPTIALPTASPTTQSPTTGTPTRSPIPTQSPTPNPTNSPTTGTPTTRSPTAPPTTMSPTTAYPTTRTPTSRPSRRPTIKPTTRSPTFKPTTGAPTVKPTTPAPTTHIPSEAPTHQPTNEPTNSMAT